MYMAKQYWLRPSESSLHLAKRPNRMAQKQPPRYNAAFQPNFNRGI